MIDERQMAVECDDEVTHDRLAHLLEGDQAARPGDDSTGALS
jgi:hypothetical protein